MRIAVGDPASLKQVVDVIGHRAGVATAPHTVWTTLKKVDYIQRQWRLSFTFISFCFFGGHSG